MIEREGLFSKNIHLRPSTLEDCSFFIEWEKDPAVTRFLSISDDRSYEEIVKEYEDRLGDHTQAQFTICLNGEKRPIGRIHISRIDSHCDSLDLTRIYIGDQTEKGKGYGREALELALAYGFGTLHAERMTLDYFTGNELAASLYRKTGFMDEGVMRHATKKNGIYADLHLMSILREEYFAENRQQ
ncbi:MAG: GNAT family N-acetyltransferase [Firmicutes bacterium]|nr:GNAT family N-acetyltransferase [Bacillota bacterium]